MNICFNKQPFELDFNKIFYTENSNKINEIKDVVLVLEKTLLSEKIVIKLNFPLKNTMKVFRTILTYPKFD